MHDLARVALFDALSKVEFGGVVVYTDKPDAFVGHARLVPGRNVITVPDWPDKLQAERFYYMESQQRATTSHALMYQWDAGVRDVNCWTDDFLAYDYIGAPWPGKRVGQWQPKDGYSVGNGGFTLMSMKLCNWLYANRDRVNARTDMDVSYKAREMAAAEGTPMNWAPEEVAYRFAFEHGTHEQRFTPSFGYHDVFNWHLAMPREEVIQRARMMLENPYIVKGTTKLRALNDSCQWVQQTIGQSYADAVNRNARNSRPVPPSALQHGQLPHHRPQPRIGSHHRVPPPPGRGVKA